MNSKQIEEVIGWLSNSDIRIKRDVTDIDGNSMQGSYRSWYDIVNKKYSYVYTEISGYAVTTLVYIYSMTGNEKYLKIAKEVGDWLISMQLKNGSFETAFYLSGDEYKKRSTLHTFDVGMVVGGLLNLYRETENITYLNASKKAADWILSLQKDDGSIFAQADKKRIPMDTSDTWSTQSGSYHAKCSIGLLNLYDITKDEKYKNGSIRLCDYAVTRQKENGQFLTYSNEDGTNLHPHIYSIEGLYVAGKYLNNQKYLSSAKKGTDWMIDNTKDGIVPRHCQDGNFNYNERVDILAQGYRVYKILNGNNPKIEKVLEKIKEYQYHGKETEQTGGFLFGKQSDGELALHVNSWVSMFSLQAMYFEDTKIAKSVLFNLI